MEFQVEYKSMNCNVLLAVADWVCHDSLHYKTCFDCFDNGDERRQPKDAQHTAPVQLSPVFVAQQRFAFRSLLISFSRFLPAYLLSPFFFFITALTSLALYVRSSTERASLFEEGGGGRWFLSRSSVPTGQWQLGCQSRT